jgi:hypothetical protein
VKHYMVDCYTAGDDIQPSESFLVKELTDFGAIREAKVHCFGRKLARFKVRSVRRSGDRIIYDSKNETQNA